ncbi:MAG TPA: PhzF family phenazine biosynthesis protein [Chloroflexi bacterium]|nr:PhzF family phenazine biosynthesis protein [Chloroflexota bacterium]
MRRYSFIQADVFTEVIFGGNPVAVFPDAEGLSDDEMQKIAREMNLSETTFVLPPTDPRADVWVRFFTPSTELPFAGHPTIGTHIVLAYLGRYEITGPVTRVWQQVGVGTLPVDLITDGDGVTNRAVMTQDEARHGEVFTDKPQLAKALGLEPSDIHPDLPAQVFSTGLPGLIIPLSSLDAIQRVKLNVGLFNDICRSMSVTGGEVFTLETLDKAHHVHVRNFDPLVGVYEDPATGSMAGALGAYLLANGVFDYDPEASTTHMVIEQGFEMGRPSLIEVEVDIRDGMVVEVRVGGQVVVVIEGELIL